MATATAAVPRFGGWDDGSDVPAQGPFATAYSKTFEKLRARRRHLRHVSSHHSTTTTRVPSYGARPKKNRALSPNQTRVAKEPTSTKVGHHPVVVVTVGDESPESSPSTAELSPCTVLVPDVGEWARSPPPAGPALYSSSALRERRDRSRSPVLASEKNTQGAPPKAHVLLGDYGYSEDAAPDLSVKPPLHEGGGSLVVLPQPERQATAATTATGAQVQHQKWSTEDDIQGACRPGHMMRLKDALTKAGSFLGDACHYTVLSLGGHMMLMYPFPVPAVGIGRI